VNSVFEKYIVIDAGFLAISKDSPELNYGKLLAVSTDRKQQTNILSQMTTCSSVALAKKLENSK
jgi:hypothetical protein